MAARTTESERRNRYGQPIGQPVDSDLPDRPSREVLAGRWCRLEPLDAERHGEELFDALHVEGSEPNWTYLPYGPFESVDSFLEFLRQTCSGDDPLFFTVADAGSGSAVGMASYLRIDPASSSIEVGHIHFGRSMQKTHAATEAMFLMMRRAFALGYRRYEWKCDALNGPSRRAAERLGFRFEGVFRQATRYKGRNRDTAWYSVIDKEWPALESAFTSWLRSENFDAEGRQRRSLAALRDSGS